MPDRGIDRKNVQSRAVGRLTRIPKIQGMPQESANGHAGSKMDRHHCALSRARVGEQHGLDAPPFIVHISDSRVWHACRRDRLQLLAIYLGFFEGRPC